MVQIGSFIPCRARVFFALGCLVFHVSILSALTCSAQEKPQAVEAVTVKADPSVHISRLRIFGQNGAVAVLFRGSACVKDFWSEEGEKASGGLGSAFGSFFGRVSNESLGIPETETSRQLSGRDGSLSKAYFREYVIPANQPSSMRLGFLDSSSLFVPPPRVGPTIVWQVQRNRSCHGAINFVPGDGKDYEVAFSRQGDACHAAVSEVVRNG